MRYWEEDLRDWRNIGEKLSQEIWNRLNWLEAELVGAHEADEPTEEENRILKKGEQDILLITS